jgi:hypothetical protein
MTITIKNMGDATVTFHNFAVGLKFQNVDTAQTYGVVSAQITTDELPPGASRMLTCNQEDDNGMRFPLVIMLPLCRCLVVVVPKRLGTS